MTINSFIEIPLTQNFTTLVDQEDEDVGYIGWYTQNQGNWVYARKKIRDSSNKRIVIYLHRIIMERMLNRSLSKEEWVDHINHNGLDNRRHNLRLATNSQNLQNARKSITNSSGFKGVSWHKKKKEVGCTNSQEWKIKVAWYVFNPRSCSRSL